MKLPIEVVTEFIELRNILHNLNQIGWSFSLLNKQYPFESLTEEDAKSLIESYKKMVENVREIVK